VIGLGNLGILISVIVLVVAIVLACIKRMDLPTAALVAALAVVNLI
jgi:hypothetical protein